MDGGEPLGQGHAHVVKITDELEEQKRPKYPKATSEQRGMIKLHVRGSLSSGGWGELLFFLAYNAAEHLRLPVEVVEPVVREMAKDGEIVYVGGKYVPSQSVDEAGW